MQLKIASELEGNVDLWPVYGGEAIKPHRKITYYKSLPCCFKAQINVALRLKLKLRELLLIRVSEVLLLLASKCVNNHGLIKN